MITVEGSCACCGSSDELHRDFGNLGIPSNMGSLIWCLLPITPL